MGGSSGPEREVVVRRKLREAAIGERERERREQGERERDGKLLWGWDVGALGKTLDLARAVSPVLSPYSSPV